MSTRQILYSIVYLLPIGVSQPLIHQYRRWRDALLLMKASRYDRVMFGRYSGLFSTARRERLEGRLIKNYHRLEKGLALPSPRPGFGKAVAEQVLIDLQDYVGAFGPARATTAAFRTLQEYAGFLQSSGLSADWLLSRMAPLQRCVVECTQADGGTHEVDRSEIQLTLPVDVGAFMRARHSVRQFAPGSIDISVIEKAVRAAQYAPSVCNRQSGHVFLVRDPEKQRRLLQLQNGNSGFGHESRAALSVLWRLRNLRQAIAKGR